MRFSGWLWRAVLTASLLISLTPRSDAQVAVSELNGRPDAIIDLKTAEGAELVRGRWRYSDAKIVEVDFRGPGPDLKPSGAPNRTNDVTPRAGADDFDDSKWEELEPAQLEARKGGGRVCFSWYRINLTIPDRVGSFDPTGSTVVFEVVIDDYAEVWVNGALRPALGQLGGPVVGGFNATNRVVLGRNVRPGQKFQLAVFGMNGPISRSPENFIWVKSATLDFYKPRTTIASGGTIERLSPALDAIVPNDAKIEKLAEGFIFTEGPVWVRDGGYLLFSDPNANNIYRWSPDGQVSVYRTKSGYTGFNIAEYRQPGSNGLTLDGSGRLTINEHGNRRVTRLEKNGQLTVLADNYQGKRLNSPNDLVYKSDGALYFTDPAFGLPQFERDPRKELPYSGVFRLKDGKLDLLATDLKGPNGIAFSPDEKFLYVSNWDAERKIVMRYPLGPDGTLEAGSVFFDVTNVTSGDEALDGLKVDVKGDLFISAPGGVWIVSPEGKHLGTIKPTERPANFTWGDADGRTLYMAGGTSLYRIRLNVAGVRP
jgi:gluconolactonase